MTEIRWPDFPEVGHLRINGCEVIFSIDDTGPDKFKKLRHASVSRKSEFPTWKQILLVKHALFGDTDVMMLLPRRRDYVNVHPNCFHLWECPTEWGIQ